MKTITVLKEQELKLQGVVVPDVPFMPTAGAYKSSCKIGNDKVSWPNESDEPHLTKTSCYEGGLIPYSNTNYTWHGTLEQLHSHIAKVQARWQRLTQEAEILWKWLAKKEAQMYRIAMQPMGESNERLAARRYVEVLGNMHQKIRNRVSQCDWMIADAQKRVSQLQPSDRMTKDIDGRPTSTMSKAGNVRAELSLPILRGQLESSEQWRQQCQAEKEAFEKVQQLMVKEAEMMHATGEMASSGKGQEVRRVRELAATTIKQKQSDLDSAMFDMEILQKVIEDAEKLANGL
ncbi:hypothetical protein LTR86_005327 [Recurvomyces mirabilis]|nr:hypothetical protein LTR86_005327 [Recurvomyces mirabilis]